MLGSQVLCKNKCSFQRAKHPGFGPSFSISCLHSRFVFLFATTCKQNFAVLALGRELRASWTLGKFVQYLWGQGGSNHPKARFLVRVTLTHFSRGAGNNALVSYLSVEWSFLEERKDEGGRGGGGVEMGGNATEPKEVEPAESTGKEEMESKSFSN